MKKPLVLLTVVAVTIAACAKPRAQASQSDGERWWAHVQALAGDDRQGRATGSEGYLEAARYVSQQFETLGIRAAGTNGYKKGVPSLFLSFGFDAGTPEERAVNTWFDRRYHGPADDTSQPVDTSAAAAFTRLMAAVAKRVGDAPQRPQWNEDSFFRGLGQDR